MKIKTQNFVIPANSPSGQAIVLEFAHLNDANLKKISKVGFAEISNANSNHYNIGIEVDPGTETIAPISKNFLLSSNTTPVNERLLDLQFAKPSGKVSNIKLQPTQVIGNADITVQVVMVYEGE